MKREPLKDVAIVTVGTRGDIQPFVAIAIALRDSGFNVSFLTNVDHCAFCESFGFDASPVFDSVHEALGTDPDIKLAMMNGDTRRFFSMLGKRQKEYGPAQFQRFVTDVTSNPPQLLVVGSLTEYYCAYAHYVKAIPTLQVKTLCIVFNDAKRAPLGFPTLPFGLHYYLMKYIVLAAAYKSYQFLDRVGAARIGNGRGVTDYCSKQQMASNAIEPSQPYIVCQPSMWKDVVYHNCLHDNFRFVGPAIIDTSLQQDNVEGFGSSDVRKRIENFLAQDPDRKPVYCGWGSMICRSPQYMVELVARALMLSGKRGIVLAGWAGLSMDMLKSSTTDKALVEYAEHNIMFVDKAPHEWLFPRVSCTIHHGGQGTLSAALRAGVPTIITPVFLDQFDSAYMVQKLGVGIGFETQLHQISSKELGEAISNVLRDDAFSVRAKEIQKQVTSENGAANVVLEVASFWKDHVLSGAYDEILQKCREDAGFNSVGEPLEKLSTSLLSNTLCAVGIGIVAIVGCCMLASNKS